MRSLTWAQVIGGRLARGRLLVPARDACEAATAAGGVHAQILSAAELSLAARLEGVTVDEVRAELWERRRLVKTWLQRGTLHVVAADELPLWTAALGSGESELVAAVAAALSDEPRTREELAELVGDARLRSAWGVGLKEAAWAGELVFGPSRGATTTFVRPPPAPAPGEDALRWALRRFLEAYGPARHGDFATWLGIPAARAKQAFADASDELEPVEVAGRRAFALGGAEWEPAPPSVRLLPQYDCYLMGSRFGREQVLPEPAKQRALAHGRGPYEGAVAIPAVLLDGVVAGFWRRDRRAITVELLRPVPRSAIRAEAGRIRAFLGEDLALEYGPAF